METSFGETGDSSIANDDALDGASEDVSDDAVDSSEEVETGAAGTNGTEGAAKGSAKGTSNDAAEDSAKGEFALCNEIGDSGLIVKLLLEEPEEESDELEDVDILSIVYKYLIPRGPHILYRDRIEVLHDFSSFQQNLPFFYVIRANLSNCIL